jgi:hypothetical protein
MEYRRTKKGLEKMTTEEAIAYDESIALKKTYSQLRTEAYGSLAEQIEFITENGLEAWQDKVAAIKIQFPKE